MASTLEKVYGLELNTTEYVDLLSKMMDHSEQLQNNPKENLIPNEDLASQHIEEYLKPYLTENGGLLTYEKVCKLEGRSNIIIKLEGKLEKQDKAKAKTLGFVGSHLDVVPANPKEWDHSPFKLARDETNPDKLLGRGTTDCLGHCALMACIFKELASNKVQLDCSLYAVLIASEENTSADLKTREIVPNGGIEYVMEQGRLECLKGGPIVWVDSADSEPCIGTAGALQWTLKAEGKLCHSGLPHKGINALELVNEACKIVQDKFYENFGPCPDEKRWMFCTPSSMKPTQCEGMAGSINQVPDWALLRGDIRFTPFYEKDDIVAKVEQWVKDMNADLDAIPTRGELSKFELPDEGRKGKISVEWGEMGLEGVACKTDSAGFFAVCEAFEEVNGSVAPFSVGGSLPLVKQMQRSGFDLQITGFGKSAVYHADNEYCLLSDMQKAFQILLRIVKKVDNPKWMGNVTNMDSSKYLPKEEAPPSLAPIMMLTVAAAAAAAGLFAWKRSQQ